LRMGGDVGAMLARDTKELSGAAPLRPRKLTNL
jgi:hypothetical protein